MPRPSRTALFSKEEKLMSLRQKMEKIIYKVRDPHDIFTDKERDIAKNTSSLTSLIIKWLEGKKDKCKEGEQYWMWNSLHNVYEYGQKTGRNQLITELIGELR